MIIVQTLSILMYGICVSQLKSEDEDQKMGCRVHESPPPSGSRGGLGIEIASGLLTQINLCVMKTDANHLGQQNVTSWRKMVHLSLIPRLLLFLFFELFIFLHLFYVLNYLLFTYSFLIFSLIFW